MSLPDELRRARSRGDDARGDLARAPEPPQPGSGVLLGRVVNGGHMPTSTPGQFLVNPLRLTGVPREGDVPAVEVDTSVTEVVTVWSHPPTAGNDLVATRRGGHWHCENGGGPNCLATFCFNGRNCGGGAAAGAAVSVTGPSGWSAAGTADSTGRWCVALPGTLGSYHVTATVAGVTASYDFSLTSACKSVTWSPCVGGGRFAVVVIGCCGMPHNEGVTVDFLQGGTTLASASTSYPPNGVLVCINPPDPRAPVVARVSLPPSRYRVSEVAFGFSARNPFVACGTYIQDLFLAPADGFHCISRCCPAGTVTPTPMYPGSDTLHATFGGDDVTLTCGGPVPTPVPPGITTYPSVPYWSGYGAVHITGCPGPPYTPWIIPPQDAPAWLLFHFDGGCKLYVIAWVTILRPDGTSYVQERVFSSPVHVTSQPPGFYGTADSIDFTSCYYQFGSSTIPISE